MWIICFIQYKINKNTFCFIDMEKAGFSKDVCRSMIAMMDWDRSGKLGFEEFKKLWIDIRQWKVIN